MIYGQNQGLAMEEIKAATESGKPESGDETWNLNGGNCHGRRSGGGSAL